jgi:hypothetical protein
VYFVRLHVVSVEQILQSVRGRQSSSKQNSTSKVDIGCVPAVAFGSRAHLEKQALATVSYICIFCTF